MGLKKDQINSVFILKSNYFSSGYKAQISVLAVVCYQNHYANILRRDLKFEFKLK